MVLVIVIGALAAAGANLWPTIAEAAAVAAEPGRARADSGAPPADEAVPRGSAPPRTLAAGSPPPVTGPSPAPRAGPRAERWEAPVGPVDPVTRFDPPPLPWLPGHRGVDLGASDGRPVVAAGPGTVVFAGGLAGRGVVSIDHPGGLRTTYEPLDPVVAPGDAVAAGQTIGHLAPGHASCPAAACLHLGLKRGSAYLDPLLLFGSGQVRLLPRPAGESP